VDLDKLRTLMNLEYRGYADPGVAIAGATANISYLYYEMLRGPLSREAKVDRPRCESDAQRLRAIMPVYRLPFDTKPWTCLASG
jgi:hypothetical protein